MVGLTEVAGKRAGGFSLGMGQRLGIAAALLGDPRRLILDEPVNGLDPDGILWIRTLLKDLAAEGRTVFVSSHLMSEMALTADHLIVIGRGRLLADTSDGRVHRRGLERRRPGALAAARTAARLLAGAGRHRRAPSRRDMLEVDGADERARSATIAAEQGSPCTSSTPQRARWRRPSWR